MGEVIISGIAYHNLHASNSCPTNFGLVEGMIRLIRNVMIEWNRGGVAGLLMFMFSGIVAVPDADADDDAVRAIAVGEKHASSASASRASRASSMREAATREAPSGRAPAM